MNFKAVIHICAKWMLFDCLQYAPTARETAVAIHRMMEVGIN